MKRPLIKLKRTNAQRKRDALIAAAVAPSRFGKRMPAQPHRDRKHEAARGERKHKKGWESE
jgi:hypothetical protein